VEVVPGRLKVMVPEAWIEAQQVDPATGPVDGDNTFA